MKIPTSDKTSSFGIKPHIKKGYYPGKLLKVELFTDRSGNAKIGKYGKQLIFEFAVYKKDQETDAPIEPMTYCTDEKLKTNANVIISKFVYHMYKKKGDDKQFIDGEYQTAVTPNGKITKLLKDLGWKGKLTEDVNPEEFIGNWVELNIEDYLQGEGDEAYTASTIKDISPYEGPEVKDIEDVKATEKPKKVEKQVKHEAVKSVPDENKKSEPEEIQELKAKIETMKDLNKDGLLTDDGLKQAVEQLNTKIEALQQ